MIPLLRERRAVVLGAVVALLPSCAGRGRSELEEASEVRAGGERDAIWFDRVAGSLDLSEAEAGRLVRAAAEGLGSSRRIGPLPEAIEADRAPRIVFVSASDGLSPAEVAVGAALGLRPALEKALAALRRCFVPDGAFWLKLDLVEGVKPAVPAARGTYLAVEGGLEGLAWPTSPLALLPEEITACDLVRGGARVLADGLEKCLQARRGEGLSPGLRPEEALMLRPFTTTSYFFDGGGVRPLYRGHRERRKLTSPGLLEAARRGGEYLRGAVLPDGRFVYSYFPGAGEARGGYNLVRHAGATYAMLELWEASREPGLLEAAERALGYLLKSVVPFGAEEDRVSVVVEAGKIKLGGVALAALALANHTEATAAKERLELVQSLCRYLLLSQKADGDFIHQRSYPTGEVRGFTSRYYPGEALLALIRAHALDGEEAWLEAAERGARYLIEVRDGEVETARLIHDHWLLYSLNELYRRRPKEIYLRHALRVARAISLAQERDPSYPDYLGSYYDPPRSTPAATRAEGLLAAYQLARDFGTQEEARSLREAIELTVGFLLQMQVEPERAMYFKDPPRSLGGFTRSLTDLEIRIDYVQHSVSALLLLYRVEQAEEAGGGK
ncbi:MAG: hypothetical protein HY721_20355 [Planctomycetes bacterium]|nr:hypothetical protein [Planctomycetota bacterium]